MQYIARSLECHTGREAELPVHETISWSNKDDRSSPTQSPVQEGDDQRDGAGGGQVREVRAAGDVHEGQHTASNIVPNIFLHSSSNYDNGQQERFGEDIYRLCAHWECLEGGLAD